MKKLAVLFLVMCGIITVNASPPRQSGSDVRPCLFVPGASVPAQIPPDLLDNPLAIPTSVFPAPTQVDTEITALQLEVFSGLWNAVNDHYVYTDFRGHDWVEIGNRYKNAIQKGLSEDDFNTAMRMMLNELGDHHSYFQSATVAANEDEAIANGQNFVGIGTLLKPIANNERAAIISVFPDSPAAEAGLVTHDVILQVDGGPIRDEFGISYTRGPEGTVVTITVQRPGEEPHDVTLTRRSVSAALPIDACLIPNTRIGYILIPTFLDETIDDQIRVALQNMTAAGQLDGLILDNRMNGGGRGSIAEAVMGMFTSGIQGYYVDRENRTPLDLQAEDIGGSQSVPLVVLVDVDTVSNGEIVSGVLRLAGRAKIVGGQTPGNVEQLRRYEFSDGSRAWIASATFEPVGQTAGIWEETGIVPDVLVATRWDLFTEANDPALAAAVDLLMGN